MAVAVATAVASALTTLGASAAVAGGIGAAIISFGTVNLIGAALTIAGLAFGRPNIPDPEVAKSNVKQSKPARVSGYGRARIGGAYMLFEANGIDSYDVLALHDGRVDGFERYWLHDDEVFLTGTTVDTRPDSRYSPNHVWIETRLGLPTETAYADVVAALPTYWTTDHRGDGIASLMLHCDHGKTKYLQEDYPNGLPQPSVVARLLVVFDPRDVAQDQTDPDTWEWRDNPVLALMDYLTSPSHGMGLPYDLVIAPSVADWEAAADVCDAAIALNAGGTEARYRLGGTFRHDNDPAEVIGQILSTFDGWMAPKGDGSITIKAGAYEAPTVTLTADHILDYSFRRFTPDEEAVNELVVSYVSAEHDYNVVETDAWTDDADIAARGRVRSQPFAMTWVPSNGQARRLAKRAMSRLGATMRGSVRTNLYGLNCLGERYIRIENPEIASMADIVVEVSRLEIDLASMSVSIDWIKADENVDAWNPATEEGDGPTDTARPAGEAPPLPVIVSITTLSDPAGVRLRVTIEDPARPDILYIVRWRKSGEVSFTEDAAQEPEPAGADVSVDTGLVASDALLEVQVASVTGGDRQSDWTAVETVDTAEDLIIDGGEA